MSMDAYKTLYEASITFGVRKQMQAEQGIPELEAELSGLTEKKHTLEAEVVTLRNKVRLHRVRSPLSATCSLTRCPLPSLSWTCWKRGLQKSARSQTSAAQKRLRI
jgi:Axonemal dynein light chain